MKRADSIAGAFLILFSLLVFFEAGSYSNRGVQIQFFGPAFFPQILCGILIVCCALLIFNAQRGKALRRTEYIIGRGFVRLCIAIVIAVAYWVSVEYLGFILASPIFLFVLMTHLGAKSLLVRIAVSLITPVVIWWIFNEVLVVTLPEGELYYFIFGE